MTGAGKEIWTAGADLSREYPVPTDEELQLLWSEYSGASEVRSLSGVFGVYTPPKTPVTAIASVDICEVVRETVQAFDEAIGVNLGRRSNYTTGTWLEHHQDGSSALLSIIQVLMNADLVKPVEGIDEIASHMQRWRENGVYCVANTSTLQGCEDATIKHTLSRYLPGCFDALVLPRYVVGHEGVTKAKALGILGQEADIDIQGMPLIHIDDADHHIDGFRRSYPDHPQVSLITPLHGGNTGTYSHITCDRPTEAFVHADTFFRQMLPESI